MNIIKQASYNKKDFRIEAREFLYRGFIQVEKVTLRHRVFHQESYTPALQRELIHRPEAAGVLLYNDQQQKFGLIEQFRIGGLDDQDTPWQLEVIAGVLDGNETPETCIRREAFEESGCTIDSLQHLFSFYPSAGACSELFHLYVAQTELPEEGSVFGMPDEGENIQLHILDYADIPTLLSNGRLRNAPVIMALQWLQQHQQAVPSGLREQT
ncbi:NUDIX domain-containing protein [Acinetobacter sp. UBA2581]|uniref:NUDIX domain-containing protein n=1 Tax=Acinetobacter sp. UBA2581 TaxID=1945932 RepID=UPI002579C202|nr:NUDIX domain-containing protein [Acinetobacter sp. UBA2581]